MGTTAPRHRLRVLDGRHGQRAALGAADTIRPPALLHVFDSSRLVGKLLEELIEADRLLDSFEAFSPFVLHTPEQIITALREAEVGLARGKSVKLMSRELGITEQTYYRWRREYGGMKVSQARRLKELERENGRLKRAVADLTLDKLILEEAAEGNF